MKKIPKFKSIKEEARFWDTHSPLDYSSEVVDVNEPFEFSSSLIKRAAKRREEKKRLLTLRMEQKQIDLARMIAQYKGLGYQTQMRLWVIEGIRNEFKIHPEMKKYMGKSASYGA